MSYTIARLALVGLCCAMSAASQAGGPTAAAHQAYLDLTAAHRVLFIAATPDDVDLVALAWCRRGLGLQTSVFHATDGGQPSADRAARIARIDEACRVARALDATPRFGHLERLDGDAALESVVRAIRGARPHVVLVAGDGEALSSLVARATDVAADRDRFDDHLQDLLYPWRVRRTFTRAEGEVAASFRVPATGLAPGRGESFAMLAATARGAEGPPPSRAYRIIRPEGEVARSGDAADVMLGGIEAFGRDELGLRKDEDFARVRGIEARIVDAGRALLDGDATIEEGLGAFVALRELNDRPYASRTLEVGDFVDEIGFQYYFRQRLPQIGAMMRHVLGVVVTPEVEAGTFAPGERFALDVGVATAGDVAIDNLVVVLTENDSFRVVYHGQGRRRLTATGPIVAEMKVAVKAGAAPSAPPAARPLTREGAPLGMQCTVSGRYDKYQFGFTLPIPAPNVRAAVSLTATPTRLDAAALGAGVDATVALRTDGPMFAFGGRPKDRPMRFKVWLDAPDGVRVTPANRVVDVRRAGETVTAGFALTGAIAGERDPVLSVRAQCLDADGEPVGRVVSTTVPIVASR